ncbi:MAG: aminotransferase, partial [Chitinophagales bacterium]
MTEFNRRSFLNRAGGFSLSALFATMTEPAWSRKLHGALKGAMDIPPDKLASDEEFWYYIQQSYTVSPSLINLNNGGVSPAPKTV